MGPLAFTLLKTSGQARRGQLKLKHGTIETPVFMPVGTAGSVKSLLPSDLHTLEAQIILGNTYHLFLRPGLEVIEAAGGLHNFIGWNKPILTDSGGFQIFSLAKSRKLTEEGAAFRSHIDGQKFTLSPEKAVYIQETLGSDIHMVLDECTPYPSTVKEASDSLDLTLKWAKRCREAKTKQDLLQFGIVQGGFYGPLRKKSAEKLIEIGFDGYAIGGVSVGEPKNLMREFTALSASFLPENFARYLMGVGTPIDLIESVALGIDMFDCVLPTRNARRGCLFTSKGKVVIKNSKYKLDQSSLDENCSCYTCHTFSKSYLRHLFVSEELSAYRLFSLHNLTYFTKLMSDIRESIEKDVFDQLLKHHRDLWTRDEF